MDYGGITDIAVIQKAIEENRVILTFDSDFGQLIYQYKYKPTAGVVYFRLPDFEPDEPAQIILDKLLKESSCTFEGFLIVVERDIKAMDYKIRPRQIPE